MTYTSSSLKYINVRLENKLNNTKMLRLGYHRNICQTKLGLLLKLADYICNTC